MVGRQEANEEEGRLVQFIWLKKWQLATGRRREKETTARNANESWERTEDPKPRHYNNVPIPIVNHKDRGRSGEIEESLLVNYAVKEEPKSDDTDQSIIMNESTLNLVLGRPRIGPLCQPAIHNWDNILPPPPLPFSDFRVWDKERINWFRPTTIR